MGTVSDPLKRPDVYQRWRHVMRGKGVLLHALLPHQRQLLNRFREHDRYLLIILDACRYDMFRSFHHLFFQGDIQAVYTDARDTFEYVRLMWPDDHAVTYLSGAVPINSKQIQINEDGALNTLYDGYRPNQHLEEIVDVWNTGWDDDLGTVEPAAVTDAALDHDDRDHVVAHYYQPHAPFIGEYRLLGYTGEEHRPNQGNPNDAQIWEQLVAGTLTQEEVRQAYRSNLLTALQEVQRLINCTNHENIVVTADHGEALGEYGVYAHPRWALNHPKVHAVPWLTVEP